MPATSDAVDHLVVAIDGPAAAGKTTVASQTARRLDALYFDTGAVYRALTLAALERGVPPGDGLRLAGLARHLNLDVRPPSRDDGRLYDVWLEERDVTWDVRSADVDRAVSEVSAHPAVRKELLGVQRRIGRSGRVVMAGRDIGTVVMPRADVKVWLDASLEERARRRQAELAARGEDRDLAAVRREIAERDRQDAERAAAPMTPAPDAVVIETDGLTIAEVVDRVVDLVVAARHSHRPAHG
ncbi:MAG TPA: (d)CMP kinase [Thermomicrobiaceae bacterium]|nr:(d)CMP kinase [Thermomicrobiaceae bacterium]